MTLQSIKNNCNSSLEAIFNTSYEFSFIIKVLNVYLVMKLIDEEILREIFQFLFHPHCNFSMAFNLIDGHDYVTYLSFGGLETNTLDKRLGIKNVMLKKWQTPSSELEKDLFDIATKSWLVNDEVLFLLSFIVEYDVLSLFHSKKEEILSLNSIIRSCRTRIMEHEISRHKIDGFDKTLTKYVTYLEEKHLSQVIEIAKQDGMFSGDMFLFKFGLAMLDKYQIGLTPNRVVMTEYPLHLFKRYEPIEYESYLRNGIQVEYVGLDVEEELRFRKEEV